MRRRNSPLRSLRVVDVSTLSDTDKAGLVDAHLISLAHALGGRHRFALVDDRHTVSVLVNEEDHIRIQAIHPGLQTDAAWQQADQLDDALSASLPIAYHPHYGYLTASLANVGTGLRLSVMVHMPASAFLERLEATWRAVEALGATVRGLYGEGANSAGDVYQVSNSVFLGLTERQISGRMMAVATFLQAEENAARDVVARVRLDDLTERVQETERQIQTVDRLTAEEAMVAVSALRLGELMGMRTHVSHAFFCRFIASLRGSIGQIASVKNRARDVFYEDTRRPASLRNKLREERALSTPPSAPSGRN